MPRSNVYALRNLSLLTKLTISLGVVSGFVLFLSGWIVSVVTILVTVRYRPRAG